MIPEQRDMHKDTLKLLEDKDKVLKAARDSHIQRILKKKNNG